jgi:hypothetical protein
LGYPPPHLDYVLILTKNKLGYILGDFFKNSSGHPDGCGGGVEISIQEYEQRKNLRETKQKNFEREKRDQIKQSQYFPHRLSQVPPKCIIETSQKIRK